MKKLTGFSHSCDISFSGSLSPRGAEEIEFFLMLSRAITQS